MHKFCENTLSMAMLQLPRCNSVHMYMYLMHAHDSKLL